MSEWLDLMLDEISRKRAEATEAAEEARVRAERKEKNAQLPVESEENGQKNK